MSISSQLFQIVLATAEGRSFNSVVVRAGDGSFACEIQKNALQALPTWLFSLFSRWIPEEVKAGNRATMNYFQAVFGDRVVKKVVSFDKRLKEGVPLSQREVKQLFNTFERLEPKRCAEVFQEMVPREQLTQIGNALSKSWNFQRVVIDGTKGPRFCRIASSIHSLIPKWISSRFSCLESKKYRKENQETICYFYNFFGYRRMDRISKRFKLRLREKIDQGTALTRGDIEKIFAGLAEVRYEDVQELLKIVTGKIKGELGTFEAEALQALQNKEFAHLTKEDYDAFYRYLVPFEEMKTIFLNNLPRFSFQPRLSGTIEKLRRRLFLCETIRREEKLDERIWDTWVSKGFLKRGRQDIGVIMPHPQGYYRVFGELEGEGASFLLMQGLQPEVPSIVKAQGTRTSMTWDAFKSFSDDLSDEVGSRGVDATEASLLYLLGMIGAQPPGFTQQYSGITEDPFRRAPDERFKGVAFSLGCANMQHLVERHPQLFSTLALACPPGISAAKCRSYAQREIGDGPTFRYIIEIDDLIHRGGEANLGVGCAPNHSRIELVVYAPDEMSREEVEALLFSPPDLPERTIYTIAAIFKAFTGAHVRQTSLREEYTREVFMNSVDQDRAVIDAVLGDDTVEVLRRQAAAQREIGARRVDQAKEGIVHAWRRTTVVRRSAQEMKRRAAARLRALSKLGTRILTRGYTVRE